MLIAGTGVALFLTTSRAGNECFRRFTGRVAIAAELIGIQVSALRGHKTKLRRRSVGSSAGSGGDTIGENGGGGGEREEEEEQEEQQTWREFCAANLDVLRFLKLVWLFRVDVLDTRGDILSSGAPKHIMAGKLAEAAAKGEEVDMGAPKV